MDLNKQWLALGIIDVFGKENANRRKKYQRISKETYELGDQCRLEPCFKTLCLLMNDQIDYQGKCLVAHIEIEKLLHYPSLCRSPAQEIFTELSGIVLNPKSDNQLGNTVSRAEYALLEKFCESIDPKAPEQRDIFWVIQHCASAEATDQTTIDREEWQYLALHFHSAGRKPKRFIQLQKKYQAINASQKQFLKPDHIHSVCKEYGICWQEAHVFIFKHGVSRFESSDTKCLKQVEHILCDRSFALRFY